MNYPKNLYTRPLEYARGNYIDKLIKSCYSRVSIITTQKVSRYLVLIRGCLIAFSVRFLQTFVVFFSIATILQTDSISAFSSYSALQINQLRSYICLIRLQRLFVQRRFIVRVLLYNQNVSSICFTYITIYLLLKPYYIIELLIYQVVLLVF